MAKNKLRVGVFDSGIGGLSVARAIERALPDDDVLFVHDTPEHFPYAMKSPEEIYSYVRPIIADLIQQNCDAIVIACNTVSTTLIGRLREDFNTPFVALEPMVKPAAALTKTGVIAVCATPTTLASARYAELKHLYASDITVLEPDCADWSLLIESNQMDKARINQEISPVLEKNVDVIVLGCTHYHWIEEEIKKLAPNAAILQPEQAVVQQLKRVLEQLP
jgi:glutamate racemase